MKTINNNIKMIKIFAVFFISIQVFGCSVTKNSTDKTIIKTWKVYKYKAGSITAITNEEADLILNKSIIITQKSISLLDNEICNYYSIKEQNVNAEDYFDSFRINYQNLKLPTKEVKLYSFTCKEPNGEILEVEFLQIREELIYIYEGFIFYLK